MNGTQIQEIAGKIAAKMPGATKTQPFGPDYDVFKVANKVFMMTTEVPGEKIVTVKCDPDRSKMLRDVFPSVRPGYHMNKAHWISLAEGKGVDRKLIEEVVQDAYKLVVAKLPHSKRP